MSYAIAPTFEGNRIGVRRLNLLSGVGGVSMGRLPGLGTIPSDATIQLLTSSGYDPAQISALVSLGASDAQLTDLLTYDPTWDPIGASNALTDLQSQLMNAAVPSPALAPQVPKGTTLVYLASWTYGLVTALKNTTGNSVIAAMAAALPQYQLSVAGSNAGSSSAGWGFVGAQVQLTIVDNIGHNLLSDVKSILDTVLSQLVGGHVGGSTLQIAALPNQVVPSSVPGSSTATFPGFTTTISPAGVASLIASTPTSPLGSWFTQNWGAIAVILAILVIAMPPLVKKL